jgi:hypothetical protein
MRVSSVRRVGRVVHAGVTYVFLAGVVLQPFLIGLWLFGAESTSDLHTGLGYSLLVPGCPLLLLAALVGRVPRREMLLTLAVIVDTFVQVSLPGFRSELPALAALHPVNFLVLVVMLWTLGRWDRLLIRGDAGDSTSVSAT